MSKVLVTGANGFVGKHLLDELLAHAIEVLAVGGPLSTAKQAGDEQKSLALDLTQPAEAQKIDFGDVTGVIHLAGLAAVGPSFDNPMRYIDTNIGIEVNLFEAALAQKARPRFLIISSGALYNPAASLPLDEQSQVLPSSPYAVSKLGQEQMAQYYTQRGLECIIARPFNHFGPGQEAGFIVPDLTQQLIECQQGKRDEVSVGNLEAQRDYTDVRDIVKAYRLLLEKGASGEVYNICSGKALSGKEILAGITKAAGFKARTNQDPARMRPSDSLVIYGNHRKLSQATGWQPEIAIETTLADVVADWRSRL